MKTFNITLSSIETAAHVAEWGTYGPTGDAKLMFVRLIDCDTEHLKAIRVQTSKTPHHPYTEIIDYILGKRS